MCRLVDETATAGLGAVLARALPRGATLLLSGPLGAGKTVLARALIRARLGEPDRIVASPSYTLVNIHEGREETVWHADLYRLEGSEDTAELGLEEAMGTALTVIEWPDRLGAPPPGAHLELVLAMAGDEARTARLVWHGPGGESVLRALDAWS